jgi:hypothetical protein
VTAARNEHDIAQAFWRGVCSERADTLQERGDDMMAWTRGHDATWDTYRNQARRLRREAAELRAWAAET